MKFHKIICGFIILFSAVYVNAQTQGEQLDSLFTRLYAKKKFNGNVLIAHKGEVILQKSYGIANELSAQQLNNESVFELASVSKQFTAMAIMMLKEKGKLSLEDTIGKFFPELKFYGHVTIRNLLNHTGGLHDYMELVMNDVQPKKKIATNKDIIRLFAANKTPADFPPGTKYEYSNTGYALLASVIMKASGMSYGEFLQKNIFTPLGMTNSFVYTRRLAPRKLKNYAFGYVYSSAKKQWVLPDEEKETEIVIWLDGIVGDGTVNSTTDDLLKWDRALYTTKLLSAEGMKEIFTRGTLNNGKKISYGMGWMIDSSKQIGKTAWHTGGWPGYSTYIDRETDNDYTVIVLQNHEDMELPTTKIRKIFYGEPAKVARKEIALTKEQRAAVEGEYELAPEVIIRIFSENDVLKTQLTGQHAFPIFAETESNFFFKVVDAQLEFVKDNTGKYNSVILHQNGVDQEAPRIK